MVRSNPVLQPARDIREGKQIVNVHDADGALVCWGGPYTRPEADAAVALFLSDRPDERKD